MSYLYRHVSLVYVETFKLFLLLLGLLLLGDQLAVRLPDELVYGGLIMAITSAIYPTRLYFITLFRVCNDIDYLSNVKLTYQDRYCKMYEFDTPSGDMSSMTYIKHDGTIVLNENNIEGPVAQLIHRRLCYLSD